MLLALPAALSVALVSAAAAAAENGLTPVTPDSANANAIRQTYWVILGVTGVIFVLVESALILFVVRYRSRGRARSQDGAQIHGATRLEAASTIVPVLILAGIAAFVFVKLPTIKDVPPLETVILEEPAGPGPFAGKSIGEGSISPLPAALANALADACGVRLTSLPLTAEKIYAALARQRETAARETHR